MSQRATDTPPDHTLDDVLAMFRRSLKAGGASELSSNKNTTAAKDVAVFEKMKG